VITTTGKLLLNLLNCRQVTYTQTHLYNNWFVQSVQWSVITSCTRSAMRGRLQSRVALLVILPLLCLTGEERMVDVSHLRGQAEVHEVRHLRPLEDGSRHGPGHLRGQTHEGYSLFKHSNVED
jgi:hypothetical protein